MQQRIKQFVSNVKEIYTLVNQFYIGLCVFLTINKRIEVKLHNVQNKSGSVLRRTVFAAQVYPETSCQ